MIMIKTLIYEYDSWSCMFTPTFVKKDYSKIANMKGGSGGGGSSSGKVDYPEYMKTLHGHMMNHDGADTLTKSLYDLINASVGNSPYLGVDAFNPDTMLSEMDTQVDDLVLLNSTIKGAAPVADLVSRLFSVTEMENLEDAYSDMLDDEIETKVLPKFKAGMRDINAVQSSAFVIGEAVIYAARNKDYANYATQLRLRRSDDIVLKLLELEANVTRETAHMVADTKRIGIVAKKEESEVNARYDEADALWDIELYQHGSNMLAAIGGGTSTTASASKSNPISSAIGGGLSGAAAGAMIGAQTGMVSGPVGAAIGGVLGLASSFF